MSIHTKKGYIVPIILIIILLTLGGFVLFTDHFSGETVEKITPQSEPVVEIEQPNTIQTAPTSTESNSELESGTEVEAGSDTETAPVFDPLNTQ